MGPVAKLSVEALPKQDFPGNQVSVTQSGRTFQLNTGLYIHGHFIESLAKGRIPVLNPSTGETFTQVVEAGPEDVDLAVLSAELVIGGEGEGPC